MDTGRRCWSSTFERARSHRIFVAFFIPKSLWPQILAWKEKYRRLPVRWIAPEYMHITLLPPWSERDIVGVTARLKRCAAAYSAFDATLTRVSFGPDPRRPRLILAEGPMPRVLAELRHALAYALGKFDAKNLFRLHLTLARFPEARFRKFHIRTLEGYVRWRIPVSAIALVESHLKRTGAEYATLATIPLCPSRRS